MISKIIRAVSEFFPDFENMTSEQRTEAYAAARDKVNSDE